MSRKTLKFKFVDGVEYKHCFKCKQWKPLATDYYNAASYCKVCNKASTYEKVKNYKRRAVAYLGDQCKDCCQTFAFHIYDIHHLDPSVKDFSVSLRTRNLESMKEELDKCVLLCANCHRDRHYNLTNKNYIPHKS